MSILLRRLTPPKTLLSRPSVSRPYCTRPVLSINNRHYPQLGELFNRLQLKQTKKLVTKTVIKIIYEEKFKIKLKPIKT